MKRLILMAVLVAVGCGGPKVSEPKVNDLKEDPRIKRAGAGTGVEQPRDTPQKGMKGGH